VRTIGIKLPCRWRAAGGEEGFGGDLAADEGAFARLRASLDPCWIEEALEATGTATLRRRRLPAEQVVRLVLGMALPRNLRRLREQIARFLLPPRRARAYPRAVKLKMSGYARKRPTSGA
jgi:Insertion element 4 transposase N-terminal